MADELKKLNSSFLFALKWLLFGIVFFTLNLNDFRTVHGIFISFPGISTEF